MTTKEPPAPRSLLRVNKFFSDRLGSAPFVRKNLNKVFPDNWTFLFGEIALYAFVILVMTGMYLGLLFKPGGTEVSYNGAYVPLRGVTMSRAYDSMLHISFDVRGGLLIRQIHHWSANVFLAAIVLHLCRVFFTAAFRKPRDLNWLIGVGMLLLGLLEGFAGYSLPDDLLSGTGLRIGYSIVESIPVVGSWLAFIIWGGEFPGSDMNDRLFFAHVLLIPGILVALITAHLGIIWHQKHTDFGGVGKSENTISGTRLYPEYAAKSGGFFLLVAGMLAALGGLAQINPIWLYGPYDPSTASDASQPDWYVGFLDGALRIMPHWEIRGAGVSVPLEIFLPAVLLPLVLFTLMAAYPFLEARFTRDRREHDQLDRPRDHPVRTGIGAMALTFYLVLLLSGGDDVLATTFHVPYNTLVWVLRILVIVGPPLAYKLTASFCRGLMQDDDDLELDGAETGLVVRHASGEYIEVSVPPRLPTPPVKVPADPEGQALEHASSQRRRSVPSRVVRAVAGFFVEDAAERFDRRGSRRAQGSRRRSPTGAGQHRPDRSESSGRER